MATSRDLYQILEIPPEADGAEIRRAYRKLARRHHPDLVPGDAEAERRFEEVAEAYGVLSIPELRRRYDQIRDSRGVRSAAAWAASVVETQELGSAAGPGWSASWSRWSRTPSLAGPVAGAGGGDAEVTITFAEAIRGTSASFSRQREAVCPECDGRPGNGAARPRCERCGGRGTVVALERVRLRIPAGVVDGERLRLGAGRGGGRASGDPEVTVRVRPDPYFRREGGDIHADLPVTLAEAIFGAEVDVPTLDGLVKVRIPPGTPGGQRFRLRDRGVRSTGREPGDHYFTVKVQLPTAGDDRLRSLLEDLGQPDPRNGLPTKPV